MLNYFFSLYSAILQYIAVLQYTSETFPLSAIWQKAHFPFDPPTQDPFNVYVCMYNLI